jgi:hypothetical protein
MHPRIETRYESSRGCGLRDEPGGMYLVGSGAVRDCGKLPVSLESLNYCPNCGEMLPVDYMIKFTRAPRMLHNPELLWSRIPCENGRCETCPLSNAFESGPALLVFVGAEHYPTVKDFTDEAIRMGISRRIPVVPKEFIPGKTWVMLAHTKAVVEQKPIWREDTGQMALVPRIETVYSPGIFGMFLPDRIEVVVTGNESNEKIEDYLDRGLTPVRIINTETGEPTIPEPPRRTPVWGVESDRARIAHLMAHWSEHVGSLCGNIGGDWLPADPTKTYKECKICLGIAKIAIPDMAHGATPSTMPIPAFFNRAVGGKITGSDFHGYTGVIVGPDAVRPDHWRLLVDGVEIVIPTENLKLSE